MSKKKPPHPAARPPLVPHDAGRDTWFRHQGFTLARYWNSDILDNPGGVLADLTSRASAQQESVQ